MNKIKSYFKKKTCAIFLFHGVYESTNKYNIINYTNKHIDVTKFFYYLNKFKNYGQNISIDDLVYLNKNKLDFPDNSFIISFDDGFKNNYNIASKILEDYNFSSIFYLTSKFIYEGTSSWIDYIEYCVEYSDNLNFDFPWGNQSYSKTKISKINFLNKIRKKVKTSSKYDQNEILDIVQKKAKFDINKFNQVKLFKKMSLQNIKSLEKNNLFTLGGHSHNHKILTHLNKKDLIKDIDRCLYLLNSNLKNKIKHFSYPEGLKNCFSNEVINLLKKRGIVSSPTAITGTNNKKTDLFRLNRLSCI